MNREMNRLKVVLAETKHTNIWLTEQLGKIKQMFPNGALTPVSRALKHYSNSGMFRRYSPGFD